MKTSQIIRKQAQAGFTLIELIVVIVILGILAATALPRMFDMSGQARLAKMQAALGAVRAASASAHAQWLVNGGRLQCTGCAVPAGAQASTEVVGEGVVIPMVGGFPDVGGTGLTATTVTAAMIPNSGILLASGLTTQDYVITSGTQALPAVDTATSLTIQADTAHPSCRFTFTEATQTGGGTSGTQPIAVGPTYNTDMLTLTNCS